MSNPDFGKISTFIFDCDGVFTDNRLLVTDKGGMLRTMNAADGMAVKHAMEQGFLIAIITGGNSQGVKMRFEGLGLKEVWIGIKNKMDIFLDIMDRYRLHEEEIIYVGDDFNDLQCLQKAGISCAPSDADPDIQSICTLVLHKKGGDGCVREILKKVLSVQNKWMSL